MDYSGFVVKDNAKYVEECVTHYDYRVASISDVSSIRLKVGESRRYSTVIE